MMSWYKSNHGSLHLHGHIHSKGDEYNREMRESGIRRYDVGVDANNYEPVSLEEILEYMVTVEEFFSSNQRHSRLVSEERKVQ